eukprot:9215044-Karenia_brevis.AAC.1
MRAAPPCRLERRLAHEFGGTLIGHTQPVDQVKNLSIVDQVKNLKLKLLAQTEGQTPRAVRQPGVCRGSPPHTIEAGAGPAREVAIAETLELEIRTPADNVAGRIKGGALVGLQGLILTTS